MSMAGKVPTSQLHLQNLLILPSIMLHELGESLLAKSVGKGKPNAITSGRSVVTASDRAENAFTSSTDQVHCMYLLQSEFFLPFFPY